MDVGVDVNVDVYVSPNKVDNWGVAIASSAIVCVGVGFIMRSVLALGGEGGLGHDIWVSRALSGKKWQR